MASKKSTGRTNIWLSDREKEARASWGAVRKANDYSDARQFIFRYGDVPCRMEWNDDGRLVPKELDKDRMKYRLNEVATYVKTGQNGEPKRLPGVLSEIVAMTLATPNPRIPLLRQLVTTPILGPRGELVDTYGYNRASRTFLDPLPGLKVPMLRMRPRPADVRRATSLIFDDLLGDFPFKDEASRAHAGAMALQTPLRQLIPGQTPLYYAKAPTPGTGKGLLINACARMATGMIPTLLTLGEDEAERRKQMIGLLLEAPVFVLFDNITSKIDSGVLAGLLTTETYSGRHMGLQRMVHLPNRALWAITGNNIQMSDEILRRTVEITLDSKLEFPEDRLPSQFRHPDLEAWIDDARGDLVWATLTIGRHWVARGRKPGKEVLGSFQPWAEVMGGVLGSIGVEGLLTNKAEQRQSAGAERERMTSMYEAWAGAHGHREVIVAELDLSVWEALGMDPTRESANNSMGFLLKRYQNRPYNGLVLERVKNEDGSNKRAGKNKSAVWAMAPS